MSTDQRHTVRVRALQAQLERVIRVGEELRVEQAILRMSGEDPWRWREVLDRYQRTLHEVRGLVEEIQRAVGVRR